MVVTEISTVLATLTTKSASIIPQQNPSSPVLALLQRCNSFLQQGFISQQGPCLPLYACGCQVGVVRPEVAELLEGYSQVFIPTPTGFYLNPQFDSFASRTEAVDAVLQDLRAKDVLLALRGWRDECFNVWDSFGSEPLFKIERSAVTVLGLRSFGVHINGYTRKLDGTLAIWLQKRAATKPTYPGMMDSMVGGGITAGLMPSQVLVKESMEEASLPEDLSRSSQAAGVVSFFTESCRGIHANNEFVYDLELPMDFQPRNADGEVEGFELVAFPDFLKRVLSPKYKLTSTPVAIDFMIRHGIINSDNESNLPAVQELLHVPLHHIYKNWPTTNKNSSP